MVRLESDKVYMVYAVYMVVFSTICMVCKMYIVALLCHELVKSISGSLGAQRPCRCLVKPVIPCQWEQGKLTESLQIMYQSQPQGSPT
jgi:BarA-like signal transduction histidine kinase